MQPTVDAFVGNSVSCRDACVETDGIADDKTVRRVGKQFVSSLSRNSKPFVYFVTLSRRVLSVRLFCCKNVQQSK